MNLDPGCIVVLAAPVILCNRTALFFPLFEHSEFASSPSSLTQRWVLGLRSTRATNGPKNGSNSPRVSGAEHLPPRRRPNVLPAPHKHGKLETKSNEMY